MNFILGESNRTRNNKELSLLKGTKTCYYVSEKSNISRNNLKDKLISLNTDTSQIHNKREFNSLELVDAIFCTFDTTIYLPSDGLYKANKIIQSTLKSLHGNKTSDTKFDGLFTIKTTSSGIGNHKGSYNLKTSNLTDQELLHEFFVSSLFTNHLRSFVPNFSYVFGAFKLNNNCQLADENNSNQICSYDTSQELDYILYEKIKGPSMGIALKTATLKEFLSWMTQIIFSLEMGVIHFGFTHYNLHTDNIFISPIDSSNWIFDKGGSSVHVSGDKYHYIPYFHKNSIWFVKSKSIAMITNYEMSHVKYNNYASDHNSEHFGPHGYTNLGLYKNETRPFYDLYKVLMWSLRILQKYNDDVFKRARTLSKFFGFEYSYQLDKALEDEQELSYIYSQKVSSLEKSRSLCDFLDLMKLDFPEMKEILIRKDKFGVASEVIDCEGYCPSSGFNTRILDVSNSISLFRNIKDVLDRYNGLVKRSKELTKICPVNDEECVDSNQELQGFIELITRYKYELVDTELKSIENLKSNIEVTVSNNENDLSQYKSSNGYKIPNKLIISTYRLGKTVESKVDLLNYKIAILRKFEETFDIKNSKNEKLTIDIDGPMQKILSNYSDSDIRGLVEN